MIGAVFAQMLVRPWSQTNEPLAARVAADFKGRADAVVVHYDVPPVGGVQRLPDAYPEDGTAGGTIRIVMAKDEYEPGSFLLYANKDLGKAQLEIGEFKDETGDVFPKEDLDLKVVKVWYQNRNAWYSYFGDTGFKLVPELLLNDENLIRVDTAKEANYARITAADGTASEQWLNPPRQMNGGFWSSHRKPSAFKSMAPGFADADTLQPGALKQGAFKQFFLTAHARPGTPAGVYRGEVKVKGEGEQRIGVIPVSIRVLDFVLPKPMCYQDETRPIDVAFYEYNSFAMIMEENGGDRELAKRQFYLSTRDHVEHGHDIFNLRCEVPSGEGREIVELARKAGCRTDIAIGRGGLDDNSMAAVEKVLGHRNYFIKYGDEPPPAWLESVRPTVRAGHEAGFKFFLAGSDVVYRKAGYQFDWHNVNAPAEDSVTPDLWNQFSNGKRVAWYAKQHVGCENPELARRQNGLALYLSGYTALANYAHHFGPYNDDSDGYKPMVYTYGQYKGVIDTLAWEGFREGIDDIRYATKLVTLARSAARDEKNVGRRYEGCKALQVLSRFDKTRDDPRMCRMEMIRYILSLSRENASGKR